MLENLILTRMRRDCFPYELAKLSLRTLSTEKQHLTPPRKGRGLCCSLLGFCRPVGERSVHALFY